MTTWGIIFGRPCDVQAELEIEAPAGTPMAEVKATARRWADEQGLRSGAKVNVGLGGFYPAGSRPRIQIGDGS